MADWIDLLGEDVEHFSLSSPSYLFFDYCSFFSMFSEPMLRVVEIEDYPDYLLALTGLLKASVRTVIVNVKGYSPNSILIAALPKITSKELHLMFGYHTVRTMQPEYPIPKKIIMRISCRAQRASGLSKFNFS